MARVTLVVNSFDEGSETFLHSLAHQLAASGHRVTVHALVAGRRAMATGASFGDGGSVVRSSALPAATSLRFAGALGRLILTRPAATLDSARRALARYGTTGRAARAAAVLAPVLATRPDVVHVAFSGIGVAILDGIELLDPATRVVVSCRGTGELISPVLDPSVRPDLRRLLQRADVVHCVSDAVARAAVDWGGRRQHVRVIRPAIDLATFARTSTQRPTRAPLRLVSVSRLHWIKAIDVQLGALAELRSRGHDVALEIVGDGPERSALEFRAMVLGVTDRVTFHGAVDAAGVRAVLDDADVFVLSSLSEGTSNAVLEAMALELPVISTSAGGMTEVVVDGQNAMVVAPGDAGSLVRAVEQIIERPDLAAEMAAAGRRTVSGDYTLERQGQQWADAYRDLLRPRSGEDSERSSGR